MSEKNVPVLLPCPFCGSTELVNDGHFVGCDDCGAHGPCTYPVPDSNKSAELWNHNAARSATKGE